MRWMVEVLVKFLGKRKLNFAIFTLALGLSSYKKGDTIKKIVNQIFPDIDYLILLNHMLAVFVAVLLFLSVAKIVIIFVNKTPNIKIDVKADENSEFPFDYLFWSVFLKINIAIITSASSIQTFMDALFDNPF